MGGGFMLSGKSASFAAANPSLYAASGTTRSFDARYSEAAICNQSNPSSMNNGGPVFGSVPTRFEVEKAILDLQRLMHGLSNTKPKLDGLQSLVRNEDEYSRMLQAPGFLKFRDTFSMMQREPSFQNMVISISCDRAVWEAILSNNAVHDLRGSIPPAKEEIKGVNCNQETDIAIVVLKWIMGFTKSKVFELVEKFGFLVNEILQTGPKEKSNSDNVADLLEEKVRSSLLLSLVIVLIVVVTRNDG
ncbi:hypothetical protein ABFS82_14G149700 [Erythranthe guttata]